MAAASTNKSSVAKLPERFSAEHIYQLGFAVGRRSAQYRRVFRQCAREFLDTLAETDPAAPLVEPLSGLPLEQAEHLASHWANYIGPRFMLPYAELYRHWYSSDAPCASEYHHPYLLHAPLGIQRAIAGELRQVAPEVFDLLMVVRPALGFTFEQLCHPLSSAGGSLSGGSHSNGTSANGSSSKEMQGPKEPAGPEGVLSGSEEYYQSLLNVLYRALVGADGEELAVRHKAFLQAVRSPYREWFDMAQYFELDARVGVSESAVLIAHLNLAQVVREYKILDEQLQSIVTPDGDELPPALNANTLAVLHGLWSRDCSERFFQELPGELLRRLSVVDEDLAKQLAQALTSKEGAQGWYVAEEFPQVQSERSLERQVGTESTATADLLAVLKQAEEDVRLDFARLKTLEREHRAELRHGAWNSDFAKEELRCVREGLVSIVARKRRLVRKRRLLESLPPPSEAFSQSRTSSAEPRAISEQVQELLATLDALIPPAWEVLPRPWREIPIADPMAAGQFAVPQHRGRRAAAVSELLRRIPISELRRQIPDAQALFDVLHIKQRLDEGVTPEVLREHYEPMLIGAVRIREALREEGADESALLRQFPRDKMLVSLVVSREKVDRQLVLHCRVLRQIFTTVLRAVREEWSARALPTHEQQCLMRKSFLALWEWYQAQVPNPYQERSQGERYSLWFERQLARCLEEHEPTLHLFLLLEKPDAVFEVAELREFNWQATAARAHYVRAVAGAFLDIAGSIGSLDIYQVFMSFCASLGSPFGGFKESWKYDLLEFTDRLFLLARRQRRLVTAEARRLLTETWIFENQQAWFGTGVQSGTLAELVLAEIRRHNPDLYRRLVLLATESDERRLHERRAELERQIRTTTGPSEALAEVQLRLVEHYLDQVDVARAILRKSPTEARPEYNRQADGGMYL
ncbi:MAG: hypothetical protein KDD69_00440 [Bdellovibrionales bacterium]|nr:hypothetical protein [Bdellovibrionales bacterium]